LITGILGKKSTMGGYTENQLHEVRRFMRYQAYSLKAGIDAVSTPYLISHESQYFYRRIFSSWMIIFSFLAYEKHPCIMQVPKVSKHRVASGACGKGGSSSRPPPAVAEFEAIPAPNATREFRVKTLVKF
jgi:hypothetical protein